MERSTTAVVPGAVLDGVGGVPASLPGPGGLKVLGHRLAFDILQERSVGPVGVSRGGGVKLGARTRSRSGGRGRDGGEGVTYLLLLSGGQGPRPSCCCSPGAGVCAGEVCARTEVRGHTCDINLGIPVTSTWRRGA